MSNYFDREIIEMHLCLILACMHAYMPVKCKYIYSSCEGACCDIPPSARTHRAFDRDCKCDSFGDQTSALFRVIDCDTNVASATQRTQLIAHAAHDRQQFDKHCRKLMFKVDG